MKLYFVRGDEVVEINPRPSNRVDLTEGSLFVPELKIHTTAEALKTWTFPTPAAAIQAEVERAEKVVEDLRLQFNSAVETLNRKLEWKQQKLAELNNNTGKPE